MSLRFKVVLATLSMIALCMVVGGIGIWLNQKQATMANDILEDNYRSVIYCQNMLDAVMKLPDSTAVINFKKNLNQELNNITEPGEQQAAKEAAFNLNKIIVSGHNAETDKIELFNSILKIEKLNLKAIKVKDEATKAQAKKGITWLTTVSTLGFIILISFAFNFPNSLLAPIKEMTIRLNEIAAGNYKQNVTINDTSEMGKMGQAFNSMVSELENFRTSKLAEVLYEKMRFENILNQLRDPLLIFDQNNNLVFANKVSLGTYFYDGSAILNKDIDMLAKSSELLKRHWALLNNGTNNHIIWNIVLGKTNHHFSPEISAILGLDPRDNKEKVVGTVLRLRDVSESMDLEEARTTFLATISHELKTPLSAVNLSLNLLEGETDQTNIKELHAHIYTENQRMLKLVNDLLASIRLQSEGLKPVMVSINLKELIQTSIEQLHTLFIDKKINISLDIQIQELVSDVEQLSLIINNLLTNAIKFSKIGGMVQIKAYSQDAKTYIDVIDDGPGVASDLVPYLFRPLQNRMHEGTGMGLALSHQLIQLVGGTLSYKREDDKSIFEIVL